MLCMLELVKHKQIVGIGSNVIGGAQAPSTLASVVVMENAERMAALSLVMGKPIRMPICISATIRIIWIWFLPMWRTVLRNTRSWPCARPDCYHHYGFQLTANHPCITTGVASAGHTGCSRKGFPCSADRLVRRIRRQRLRRPL